MMLGYRLWNIKILGDVGNGKRINYRLWNSMIKKNIFRFSRAREFISLQVVILTFTFACSAGCPRTNCITRSLSKWPQVSKETQDFLHKYRGISVMSINVFVFGTSLLYFTQTVVCLLDHGADVNRPNHNGWTPIHFACRWNKLTILYFKTCWNAALKTLFNHCN